MNIVVPEGNTIVVNKSLNLANDGLFINKNTANFVIKDGAQFIYDGEQPFNATIEKNIAGYSGLEGNRSGYYFISNPTNNSTVAGISDNSFDLYSFDPTEVLEWRNHRENPIVERKTGYLYANSKDVVLQFAGIFNNENGVFIPLKHYEGEAPGREFPHFNLVGNPYSYPAYLQSEYSFYRIEGEAVVPCSGSVQPCEGIFVEAFHNEDEIFMSRVPVRNSSCALNINVSRNGDELLDRAVVRFDKAYDLHKFMLNPESTSICIAKNGEEFAVVATEAKGEIPVNFKAEKNDRYTIAVDAENVEAEYLHLIDNLTDADVDLLAAAASTGSASYTFDAKTDDYAYRFKLVFSMEFNDVASMESTDYACISNGNLVIDHIEGEATLQIVDMLGRMVSTEIVSRSYNKTLNLKAGLYIINLNGLTQKLVVE